MLSDKPMRFRLAVSLSLLAALFGLLYLELWINFWFQTIYTGDLLVVTALGGAFLWSWTLPHPRQERKRREKLEELRKQSETEKIVTEDTP